MTARDLATALGATLLDNDGDPRVLIPGGGFIYCAQITGKVRLDRPGRTVVTLGGVSDDTDALVAAYRAAVAEAVA